MSEELLTAKRNLFEIENARNLNPKELVDTFVPTQSFWRLLSAKHHVVYGARGSGKTAIAKMMSHDHLSMLDDSRAKTAIKEQQFIGVYVPTKLEWVGALKNKPWQSEAQKEVFFQWRLNLSSCLALITTLESCLRSYCGNKGAQAIAEAELASELGASWADNSGIETLDELRCALEDIDYSKHRLIAHARATGDMRPSGTGPGPAFESDLFVPLRRGITLASRIFKLKTNCTWLICLDEAEFLDELHHRIINSLMRAHSGNVFFKITTMPYCHYTLATNTNVTLTQGEDFEYVYIDFDTVLFAKAEGEKSSLGSAFARKLFERRAAVSGTPKPKAKSGIPDLTIDYLLGRSILLDDKDSDWELDSPMMDLLTKYASTSTVARAKQLIGNASFKPTISRKMHGALLLREAFDDLKGRGELTIYSGASMAVRCGDANPRRLIRIFNALLLEAQRSMGQDHAWLPQLSQRAQTRVLRKISTSYLDRVQSEPEVGKNLHDFLTKIGSYMRSEFYDNPLTTDYVTSILIEKNVTDREWELVKRGVQLGLLFPNIGPQQRAELPNREGAFRLAFVLAPHFYLLPRRGHPIGLATIIGQMKLF
jgi:hypothetical protein